MELIQSCCRAARRDRSRRDGGGWSPLTLPGAGMEFLPRHCAVCGSGESHPRPGSSRAASPACHTRPVLLLSLCTSSSGIPSPPPRPWPLLRAVPKAGGKHGPEGFPCSVPAFKPGAVGSRGCRNTELGTAEQSRVVAPGSPGGCRTPQCQSRARSTEQREEAELGEAAPRKTNPPLKQQPLQSQGSTAGAGELWDTRGMGGSWVTP